MAIRFLDMFAGIGGFRSGLEAVGGFQCVGHCEIDKYAHQAYTAMYDVKGEVYFEDARTIDPAALPDIDLICGGFPCQSFSIAGRRRGFEDDTRGTLFFEIARLAAACRPSFLLLENVSGLLSHDGGRSFATILYALDDLGYDVAWEVLNSKDFGVPQSRKRVYIVGYLRERCAGEILSVAKPNGTPVIQVLPGPQGRRIYSDRGVGITLTGEAGGFGGRSGLYQVSLPIKVKTKAGYQSAYPGDSIDLAYPNLNSRRGHVGEQVAHTITTDSTQGVFFIDLNEAPTLTDTARCITTRQDSGISNHRGEHPLFQYRRAKEYLDKNSPFYDPAEAVRWLLLSAAQGYEYAQYQLGKLYLNGDEIAQDIPQAEEWFEKACAQGNCYAKYSLAKMHLAGLEQMCDTHKAVCLLRESADDGNGWAQYLLGKFCFRGEHTEKNVQEAQQLLTASANQNNSQAQYLLAKLYLGEDGVPKDIKQVLYWLRESVNQENQYAQYQLGKMLLFGQDAEQEVAKGVALLSAAAEQGNVYAARLLQGYYSGRLTSPSVGMASVRLLTQLACIFEDHLRKTEDGQWTIVEKKLRRQIEDKKQAHGMKME